MPSKKAAHTNGESAPKTPPSPSDLLKVGRRSEPLVRKTIALEGYQLDWLQAKAAENRVNMSRLIRALLDIAIDEYDFGED